MEQDGDTDSNQDSGAGEDPGGGVGAVEFVFSGHHGEKDREGGAEESHDCEHHGVGVTSRYPDDVRGLWGWRSQPVTCPRLC